MTDLQKQQETEKLDILYFCKICGKSFLFNHDVEDHKEGLGHTSFTIFTLEGQLSEA
jgi:hypothetical protein